MAHSTFDGHRFGTLPGRIAFTYPSFTLYQLARFFIVLATEMQSVAVGWQVYAITLARSTWGWSDSRNSCPESYVSRSPATPPIATIARKC